MTCFEPVRDPPVYTVLIVSEFTEIDTQHSSSIVIDGCIDFYRVQWIVAFLHKYYLSLIHLNLAKNFVDPCQLFLMISWKDRYLCFVINDL